MSEPKLLSESRLSEIIDCYDRDSLQGHGLLVPVPKNADATINEEDLGVIEELLSHIAAQAEEISRLRTFIEAVRRLLLAAQGDEYFWIQSEDRIACRHTGVVLFRGKDGLWRASEEDSGLRELSLCWRDAVDRGLRGDFLAEVEVSIKREATNA